MRPDIILHVGMPKSGTTALQKFLSENDEELARRGVLYPESGRLRETHKPFFRAVCAQRPGSIMPPPTMSPAEYAEAIRLEATAAGARTIILSSEAIFNRTVFDRRMLQDLKELLGFGQVSVLAYLRRPGAHLESSFAQSVTGVRRYAGSASKFWQERTERGDYDYQERLEQFADVFGRDRVTAFWYEDVKQDIAAPLLRLVGIESDESLRPPERSNERRSWFYVRALSLANKVERLRASRKVRDRLMAADAALMRFGLAPLLDRYLAPYREDDLRALDERYAQVNSRVRTDWGDRPVLRSETNPTAIKEEGGAAI